MEGAVGMYEEEKCLDRGSFPSRMQQELKLGLKNCLLCGSTVFSITHLI